MGRASRAKGTLEHRKEMEARALRRDERSKATRKCPPVVQYRLGWLKKKEG
jgi:hypothetical protein